MTNTLGTQGFGTIGADVVGNQLTYPSLSQNVVETALAQQVYRQFFYQYPTNGYPSVTVPIQGGSKTAVVNRVSPGENIPLDVAPITASTITVYKIGRGAQIFKEWVLFQQFPFIQTEIRRLGLVLGNTIDVDCEFAINAGVTNDATHTNAVSGVSLGVNGTQFTINSTVGQYDIVNSKVRMMGLNLYSDTLAMGALQWGHVSKLPMYHSEYLYGKPVYQTGEMGYIEGLTVAMSNNTTSGQAYILNTGTNNSPLKQFTPMGYFAEAQPIQTNQQEMASKDSFEIYGTTMYVPAVVLSDCIQRLTGATG